MDTTTKNLVLILILQVFTMLGFYVATQTTFLTPLQTPETVMDVSDTFLKYIDYSPEVEKALKTHQPIVALETTIITHGLPYPDNLKVANELEDIIRQNGAIPATIGIVAGRIQVGFTKELLSQISTRKGVLKVGIRDIPQVVSEKKWGGTTVAATSRIASLVGIKVFVTGGLGGVHRGAEETFDVSNDLNELSINPICLVCAGAKIILDLPKTLEYLETSGVSVLGYQTENLPQFYVRSSNLSISAVNSTISISHLLKVKDDLNIEKGTIVAVPIPEKDALNETEISGLLAEALEQAKIREIRGKAVTPFILGYLNSNSQGKTIQANVALIKHNAEIGSKIAFYYNELKLGKEFGDEKESQKVVKHSKIVVVGASVMDFISRGEILPEVSVEGVVQQNRGGVGHNMAENIHLIGNQMTFLSVLGNDFLGNVFRKSFEKIHMETSGIVLSEFPTAVYSGVINQDGSLIAGVIDKRSLKGMTVDKIEKYMDLVTNCEYVVIDTNFELDVIKKVILSAKGKVWLEPTGGTSLKILIPEILERIDYFSPNNFEIEWLAKRIGYKGGECDGGNIEECIKMSELFVARGVKNLIVKLGPDGVLVVKKEEDGTVWKKTYTAMDTEEIKDVHGAGDSLSAATVAAMQRGYPLEEAIYYGLACAKMTLESEYTINPKVNWEKLEAIVKEEKTKAIPKSDL
ncbi:hypothetical protein EIN_155590 [Entamoeba invadens IP1]|uniref:Carbohydrate kinase PfkB domain-containing protein n=1 Tax=Entamoeba invadens IP1 TaxID=370355 RepID=A0A0A1U9C3_ENTIV|nr:hypothetical protein EIN_155590 [Entamoeba invadens IP1]ELP91442.1 hypothetical protein EIN_155590 [Entamoeba invadens IP1]|eukprot:XP_004258213.1 hypothetical protein EIN_155590 [Entamoeba invadens IP1]